MCGVAMYQGRALADINLTGIPLAEALEAFISRRDPNLENVQVKRAIPTGAIFAAPSFPTGNYFFT